MADTERMPHCARCQAQDSAIPTEAQLRLLATEDWDADKVDFIPRPMTQEQAVAAEMFVAAAGRFIRAFGLANAGARLSSLLNALRLQARTARVTARILEARAEINSRARDRYAVGDIAGARAIEAEPTPDYPGKAKDDAWMRGRP